MAESKETPQFTLDTSSYGRLDKDGAIWQYPAMNSFFANHEVITLVGLALFPRITLLVASFATGGFLWWLGWIITPHLLVAILSLPYWDSNPVLVVIAWLCAIGGTGVEGAATKKRRR